MNLWQRLAAWWLRLLGSRPPSALVDAATVSEPIPATAAAPRPTLDQLLAEPTTGQGSLEALRDAIQQLGLRAQPNKAAWDPRPTLIGGGRLPASGSAAFDGDCPVFARGTEVQAFYEAHGEWQTNRGTLHLVVLPLNHAQSAPRYCWQWDGPAARASRQESGA